MKRLTKTFRNGECHTLRTCCAPYYKKLSQYEDIDEELGIDLITLFKALKNGAKFDSGKVLNIPFEHYEYNTLSLRFDFIDNEWILVGSGYKRRPKDYGKTWALTKEELL